MPDSAADTRRIAAFCAEHMPALLMDQVRHNMIVAMLDGAVAAARPGLLLWSLGPAGCCAAMMPTRPIVLADLDDEQCLVLAEATSGLDYRGVVGPDDTAPRFAEHAAALGVSFEAPMRQRILALGSAPAHPRAAGAARQAMAGDLALVADWVAAFLGEVMPHDPVPSLAVLAQRIGEGTHWLWEVDGRPVSMAAIGRRTRDAAAINSVYTPPAERGRGYAGAVTAAVVEQIFGEGRATACLYTDTDNPASNRCYQKIGFRQVCEAWLLPRARPEAAAQAIAEGL